MTLLIFILTFMNNNTLIKRPLLLAITTLLYSSSFASTPGVTFLFSNGQKASFAFTSNPKIVVDTDKVTISSSDRSTTSYAFADVQRFYFEDDINTAIFEVESATFPVFDYTNNIVTVSGITAGERLTIVTLSGSQCYITKANNKGQANFNLNGLSTGVYIVSTGSGVSFKLLKK